MEVNKTLKIILILTATWFTLSLVSLPKTDCQACEIEYKGKIIDGYEAFEIFEDGCISYNAPWDNKIALNISLDNITMEVK